MKRKKWDFPNYIRTEWQKIRTLNPKQRAVYIWGYYKLWIIGVAVLLGFGTWFTIHYRTTKAEDWFFACFANTHAELGDDSDFWREYAEYAGYDLNEKNLVFVDECYFDPDRPIHTSQYYQLLIAYMDSGALDALVIEKDRIGTIGAKGRLMDLENPQMSSVLEKYKDRLIYCEPEDEEYGKERIPVGIDLEGSRLVGSDRPYTEGAALGVNAKATHLDQIETFLQYLFNL